MGFSSEKFRRAEFTARTERVVVPQLADFFDDGDDAVIVVRGLTASELQRAIEAGNKQGAIDAVVRAISSKQEQVEDIRKALGMSNDTPGEIAKRMEMLVLGAVSPKLDHADVAKLAEVCPVEFYDMTNKIVALTGQGGSRVKPQPSSQAIQE